MIRRARRDGKEARGMREGRKEDREKEQREDRKTKRQFEEGMRDPPFIDFYIRLCDVAIASSSPQGITSWSSSIKIRFLQAYRMHY